MCFETAYGTMCSPKCTPHVCTYVVHNAPLLGPLREHFTIIVYACAYCSGFIKALEGGSNPLTQIRVHVCESC